MAPASNAIPVGQQAAAAEVSSGAKTRNFLQPSLEDLQGLDWHRRKTLVPKLIFSVCKDDTLEQRAYTLILTTGERPTENRLTPINGTGIGGS